MALDCCDIDFSATLSSAAAESRKVMLGCEMAIFSVDPGEVLIESSLSLLILWCEQRVGELA
jgi:hypothetical protein